MLRDDESRVRLPEMSRWLVPLVIVMIGLTLFFLLARKTRPIASPVHVEAGTP
jgi:cytochrome c-type biogenesis protein CcmH/NrfF